MYCRLDSKSEVFRQLFHLEQVTVDSTQQVLQHFTFYFSCATYSAVRESLSHILLALLVIPEVTNTYSTNQAYNLEVILLFHIIKIFHVIDGFNLQAERWRRTVVNNQTSPTQNLLSHTHSLQVVPPTSVLWKRQRAKNHSRNL